MITPRNKESEIHPSLLSTAKKSIYTETQNQEALQRLRTLEDTSRYQRKTTTEEIVTQAPVFTMPIKDLRVAENQAAHFEARVIPVGDPKLKVEWLRNGVAISACKLPRLEMTSAFRIPRDFLFFFLTS